MLFLQSPEACEYDEYVEHTDVPDVFVDALNSKLKWQYGEKPWFHVRGGRGVLQWKLEIFLRATKEAETLSPLFAQFLAYCREQEEPCSATTRDCESFALLVDDPTMPTVQRPGDPTPVQPPSWRNPEELEERMGSSYRAVGIGCQAILEAFCGCLELPTGRMSCDGNELLLIHVPDGREEREHLLRLLSQASTHIPQFTECFSEKVRDSLLFHDKLT